WQHVGVRLLRGISRPQGAGSFIEQARKGPAIRGLQHRPHRLSTAGCTASVCSRLDNSLILLEKCTFFGKPRGAWAAAIHGQLIHRPVHVIWAQAWKSCCWRLWINPAESDRAWSGGTSAVSFGKADQIVIMTPQTPYLL